MRYIRFLPKVIELDQKQPERTRTFSEIVARSVTPQRKEDVRQHLAENAQLLQRVQQRFGVQPAYVVALWVSRAPSAMSWATTRCRRRLRRLPTKEGAARCSAAN
jgi:anti-sigma factor RsiW